MVLHIPETHDHYSISKTTKETKMPSRLNYMVLLGQERCNQLLTPRIPLNVNENDCWLFLGSTNNDGYGQVTARSNSAAAGSRQTAFLLHIVAFVAENGQHNTSQHISHLCHQRRCFNPHHLVSESISANNSRKGCPGDVVCEDCDRVNFHCPHLPKCISRNF